MAQGSRGEDRGRGSGGRGGGGQGSVRDRVPVPRDARPGPRGRRPNYPPGRADRLPEGGVRTVLHAALGRIRYGPALAIQHRLHALRREGKVGDVVLSLEHESVITIGRRGDEVHILASREDLERAGVEVFPVERGGDVTYHGPGQLVLYPILDLRERGKDLHRYVGEIEETMVVTARTFGVEAVRREGFPGVWHARGKLGSVGIHVRDWVTMHGLALNVDLDPDGFRWIVPCGIVGANAVSIADLAGVRISVAAARDAACAAFANVFGVELLPVDGEVIAGWTRESRTG
ncbi:TPA: hypothetical protein DCY65_04930 [Candidatus Acetothermia bacterium]|nr:hypothetical protein [Candidatus Acetothermia bacterium]